LFFESEEYFADDGSSDAEISVYFFGIAVHLFRVDGRAGGGGDIGDDVLIAVVDD
jgi:hypothetical protein